MRRTLHLLSVLTLLGLGSFMFPTVAADAHRDPLPFKDTRLKIEVNATDGDAGLQLFLDGDSWKELRLHSPSGRKLLELHPKGQLKQLGLTELFFESSEPPFTELPFDEFKRIWPEGDYPIRGTSIDGKKMAGEARLTHHVLDAPTITRPDDGASVPADNTVVAWEPVDGAANYQVLVTREDLVPKHVLSVDLPGHVHQLTLPPEFLESGVEYAIEVMALEEGGNQIFTEIHFTSA